MITKEHRFSGQAGLRFVYRRGHSVRGPLFSIKCVHNPRRSSYRAAVVISRKVHKSAVVRNKVRRRLYETIGRLEADISGPYDIVINVYQASAADEPFESLERQLRKQLKDAGALAKRVTN
ncbi:MAG TPA: ribonuclease P protein component [Candidatus Saccharimonadales bacterium]|nr:ribonuclease P protein component [Candidatus Saccharimonadales bacterium]